MSNEDEILAADNPDINDDKKYNNGMFFVDGVRKIDFVLVYERINDNRTNQIKRMTFLKSLLKEGLEIEIQDDGCKVYPFKENSYYDNDSVGSPSHRSNIVFIKVFATWETLCRYAEVLKIRKQMLSLGFEYDFNRKTIFQRLFETFDFLNIFNINELKPIPRGFTTPYSKSKEYLFDIPEDNATFFTAAERSLIVNYILRRASYRRISDKCAIEPVDIDVVEDILSRRCDVEMATITDENNVNEMNFDTNCQAPSGDKPFALEDISNKTVDFGIAKLISEGVFDSAYILHERPLNEDDDLENVENNERNLLYKHWVSMRNIFRLQPLDHIKLYFGEKVAFYFAWLGYYTYWLLPISLLGIIVSLYNIVYTSNDIVVKEIYQGTNITMCPLMCSSRGCRFWKLSDAYSRFFLIRLLDNGATVLMAVVMSIWVGFEYLKMTVMLSEYIINKSPLSRKRVNFFMNRKKRKTFFIHDFCGASLFLEMWKRQQVQLAYHWNVHDMEYEDEPARPEFVALIDKNYPKKTNLISGKEEPFIPFWRRRMPVMFFTYSTVLLSIAMALAFLGGIILYKLVSFSLMRMHHSRTISNMSSIITAATGSLLSLVIIMSLTLVYSRVAVWLTDMEHHRTQSQYDSSVTLKLYLLEFINNYSSIFYIGFIQPFTQPIPSFRSSSMIKPRGCPAGGCLLDLSLQLAFIMIGKQIISHIKEYALPRLVSTVKRYKLKQAEEKLINQSDAEMEADRVEVAIKDKATILDPKCIDTWKVEPELIRCYADNILSDPGPRPLFGEYLEMLIQFGFITIFIPAFPLAPLLALTNNLFEIRSDALKFARALRRPVAQRVKDIGIWVSIMSMVATIAVKSNAILIAFATTYIDKLIYIIGYSENGFLNGFTDFSLSYMNSSEFNATLYGGHKLTLGTNETYCRYSGFRHPPWETKYEPYSYTPVYWQILAAKVVFVYLFENLVYLFMAIIAVVIPDVPDKLRIAMKREATLTNEIILKADLLQMKNQHTSKLVADSFKKSAVIAKKFHNQHKPSPPLLGKSQISQSEEEPV